MSDPIRVGTRRSSPPRPRMRSAGGTNGDGVIPMLAHTMEPVLARRTGALQTGVVMGESCVGTAVDWPVGSMVMCVSLGGRHGFGGPVPVITAVSDFRYRSGGGRVRLDG